MNQASLISFWFNEALLFNNYSTSLGKKQNQRESVQPCCFQEPIHLHKSPLNNMRGMEESFSLSPLRIFLSRPSAFGGMLTWNIATKSSCLESGPEALKSLMPPEVKTLQKDHTCISFASDSPCNSAWGTGREGERGKVLLHIGISQLLLQMLIIES